MSTTATSSSLAHLQPPPEVAQPAHAAQRDDVGRGDDHHLVGHLGADRARLGDLRAEVDDGQRVARLDRAEHVARDAGVDLLAALALVGGEQHAEALPVRVERLLQVADGDLVGDLDEVDRRCAGSGRSR